GRVGLQGPDEGGLREGWMLARATNRAPPSFCGGPMELRSCVNCLGVASGFDFFVNTRFMGRRTAYRLQVCPDCRDVLQVMLEAGARERISAQGLPPVPPQLKLLE